MQGRNNYGQLGYEDTSDRGDDSNEMGDFLSIIDLGDDFIVSDFATLYLSTCAASTSGNLKCFGRNQYGQLGYGDTTTRGNSAGSMGDALSVVDIGTGFSETGWSITHSDVAEHICVFEESTELLIKC